MAFSITPCFKFITALQGFHVYGNTVNWKQYNGQEIVFKCELNNKHDKFAVCGKAMLPGKIASVIVGHVPKEISRYFRFAIQKGAKVSAIVVNTERLRFRDFDYDEDCLGKRKEYSNSSRKSVKSEL